MLQIVFGGMFTYSKSYSGSPLYNFNKYIANMSKMITTTPRILPRFPTTSEMFPLKILR